jgi:hypothetical protein
MIVTKLSTQQAVTQQNLPGVIYNLNSDLNNLFQCLQGKTRFGGGISGNPGENISGQWLQITTNGSANSESTFTHNMGAIPIGYFSLWQDKDGVLYQGPKTGTPWTSTTISLKCSHVSVTFLLFLLR